MLFFYGGGNHRGFFLLDFKILQHPLMECGQNWERWCREVRDNADGMKVHVIGLSIYIARVIKCSTLVKGIVGGQQV